MRRHGEEREEEEGDRPNANKFQCERENETKREGRRERRRWQQEEYAHRPVAYDALSGILYTCARPVETMYVFAAYRARG